MDFPAKTTVQILDLIPGGNKEIDLFEFLDVKVDDHKQFISLLWQFTGGIPRLIHCTLSGIDFLQNTKKNSCGDGVIKKDNNWRFKSFMILNGEDKHSLHNYINTAKGEDWTSLKEELTDKCKQLEKIIIKKRKKHYYQAKHYLKKFPRGKKKGK